MSIEKCPRCGAPATCVSRSTFEQYEPSGFQYDQREAIGRAVDGMSDEAIRELTPIVAVGEEPDWWFNDTAAFRAALKAALGGTA